MRTPSRLVAVLSFAVGLTACPPPPPAPIWLTGDGWAFTASGGTLTLGHTAQRSEQVRFDPDAWVIGTVPALENSQSYDPYWLFVKDGIFSPVTPPGLRWRSPKTVVVTQPDSATLNVAVTYDEELSATVTVSKTKDGHLLLHFVPGASGAASVAYLRVRAHVDSSEPLYGLGEWFDGANHRGKLRPMQLEANLTVESANTDNHVVVPFLVGERGWGLFVESDRFGVFDVAQTSADLIDTTWGTAEASGEGLQVHLFTAAQPLDVVRQYLRVTGLPKLPPPWALGPWLWRNENQSQAELLNDVETLRRLDLPTSGLWLDRPYATAVNTFDLDPRKFPDAGLLPDALAAAGLSLAVWHTPYLEPAAEPFRSEAVDAGYFPLHAGTLLNRWSPPLDFTNPAASAYWTQQLRRYTQHGVKGFKLDFAEDVAAGLSGRSGGWRFFDGRTERTMQSQYTRLYHEAYRQALGDSNGFLLVRSARAGSQRQGVIVWPGDIDATLTSWGETFTAEGKSVVGVGGLPSALRAGVGLSLCGLQLASDTGGYRHSPPDKETFIRWVEHSALMPVMQTGDASSQPPWVFTSENGRDDEALGVYRDFARLHLRLFPWFYSELTRLSDGSGPPIVRPWAFAFPGTGLAPEDVYVLGDAFLVAPVERAGVRTRTVPVPPVAHESFWDGAPLTQAPVDAPLTRLPLFLRQGALVPMLSPGVDTLAPATQPGVESLASGAQALWVRVVPSEGATQFDLYDGAQVTQTRSGGVVTLGATAGRVFSTTITWEAFNLNAVTHVTHGATELVQRSSFSELESVATGWAREGGLLRVKHALDGQPTRLE